MGLNDNDPDMWAVEARFKGKPSVQNTPTMEDVLEKQANHNRLKPAPRRGPDNPYSSNQSMAVYTEFD